MNDCIFVYGTLRTGLAPPSLRKIIGQWRKIGDGSTRGRLYDLGEYPGAILDSGEARIVGEVFQLPDGDETLAALDEYEGFDPCDPTSSLFLRRRCEVDLEDGRSVESWVYVYNRRVSPSTIIQGGDYFLALKAKAPNEFKIYNQEK
jgi:gamma-glutamylcyclotransferase (GGCT)/AIG2-like uncharacterized protein YtfP